MYITELYRYPIKSMLGESVQTAHLTEKGVYGDRTFGLIDTQTEKLANAKNPKKWPNIFAFQASYTADFSARNDFPAIRITLPDQGTVLHTDDHVHDILSKHLQRKVILQGVGQQSVAFEEYNALATTEQDIGDIRTYKTPENTFFDAAPIHIVTTSTLNKLSQLLPDSMIQAERFRPNIVIDTGDAAPFIEETWIGKTLHIGENVQIKIIKPTKRCVMTTLAQGKLPSDLHILKTIFRENNGMTGVYAEVIQDGKVRLGDTMTLT